MANCAAKTRKGESCQNPVSAGQKYCHVHYRQRLWHRILSISTIGTVVFVILGVIADVTNLLVFFAPSMPTATPISMSTVTLTLTSTSTPTSIPTPSVTPTSTPDTISALLKALEIATKTANSMLIKRSTKILDDIEFRESNNVPDSVILNDIINSLEREIADLKQLETENAKRASETSDTQLVMIYSTLQSASIIASQEFGQILEKIKREISSKRSEREIIIMVKGELLRLKNLPEHLGK